jgi:hypothetical protein
MARDMAHMGEVRNLFVIWVGKPEGKIILDWVLGKLGGRVWTGFIWLRVGTSGGLL